MEPDSRKPDPNRWSTNKRVKALGENIFGSPALTAEGSKRVRPGDPNTTSAEFVGASDTKAEADRKAREQPLIAQETFLNEARRKLLGRGWLSQEEKEGLILQSRKSQGDRT